MNADQLGLAVKRWCRTKAAYRLLDQYIQADTWTAGGCVALAYGLHAVLPGSRVVGILRTFADGNQAIDHVAVEWRGRVIDADGAHRDRRHWLQAWMDSEAMEGSDLGPVVDVDDESEDRPLPNDKNGVDEVADALGQVLGLRVTAAMLDRAARILGAEAAGAISPIASQDIPAVLDVLSQAFAGIVDARTVQSIVNDLADWTMSRKLVVDDKIVGAYVLGSQSVLDFADNALEDLEPYRGKRAVHGVALGLLPEYRGSRLGAKLRDVPRSMPADYVWGMQYKVLGNISHWTRFGRRVVADEGDYVITLMDL